MILLHYILSFIYKKNVNSTHPALWSSTLTSSRLARVRWGWYLGLKLRPILDLKVYSPPHPSPASPLDSGMVSPTWHVAFTTSLPWRSSILT